MPFVLGIIFSCGSPNKKYLVTKNVYPWCIVAYDSLERSPFERIKMLKELGFEKYAYDWRNKHLNGTLTELTLATKNNIEIISVWLWLNAERDSLGQLSVSNERLFEIVKQSNLETTFWLSFSGNFFSNLSQEESLEKATLLTEFIAKKAYDQGCKVALYNHSGWFGNPYNQIKIINALPKYELSMVYNFHHGHNSIETFPDLVKTIRPYLSAVNLNGMRIDGEKILTIGKGNFEKEMVRTLKDAGFDGPWGILGHVEDVDVRVILEQNIKGLNELDDK